MTELFEYGCLSLALYFLFFLCLTAAALGFPIMELREWSDLSKRLRSLQGEIEHLWSLLDSVERLNTPEVSDQAYRAEVSARCSARFD